MQGVCLVGTGHENVAFTEEGRELAHQCGAIRRLWCGRMRFVGADDDWPCSRCRRLR
ncbi:hypothetical protein EMIT0196P_40395 [Pseudomonas chlororaphis]